MSLCGVLGFASPGVARAPCEAPQPVCAARGAVFAISGFDPQASAVRIAADLLVTNRHTVADLLKVTIHLPGGGTREGLVLPSSFAGDLILVRAKLPDGPVLKPGASARGDLWSVGQDISARRIRVYPRGKLLLLPFAGKPHARLHHTAYSQPGNSGGALVNASGELIGVTASGGEGRFEAVPADQIADLQAQSGPDHAETSAGLGKNIRECTLLLEKAQRLTGTLPETLAGTIKTSCAASENRQLFDLAAQIMGRQRRFDDSIALFRRALDKDPNAINSRLGLVIVLRFARRMEQAKTHVRWLLDVIPEERLIHPIALQLGKTLKDQELIGEALGLIEKHAPNQLEAAKQFLKSPAR